MVNRLDLTCARVASSNSSSSCLTVGRSHATTAVSVDVVTEIVIIRPDGEVTAFAIDPPNARTTFQVPRSRRCGTAAGRRLVVSDGDPRSMEISVDVTVLTAR